jgi:hypothetical protein
MSQSYNCPDCKDTGVYQGLNTVEPCRACGGKRIDAVMTYTYTPWPSPICINNTPSGQSIRHEIQEQAAEPKSVSLSQEQLKAIAKDHPPSQRWHGGEFCVPILVDGGIGCVSLPFDEIMPADLEGYKPGRFIDVEIVYQDINRLFAVVHKVVDRPLFGLPAKTMRLIGVAIKNGEATGTLAYGKPGEAHEVPYKNSLGETLRVQVYETDPCSDMLFIPIVED